MRQIFVNRIKKYRTKNGRQEVNTKQRGEEKIEKKKRKKENNKGKMERRKSKKKNK